MINRLQPVTKSRRGSTLIVVVLFLALLTVLVLGFLARALLELEISNSSANQNKSDYFAKGAIDCITGDLRQEIVDGSTVVNQVNIDGSSVNLTTPLYQPNSNINMVPAVSGITPSISSGVEIDGLNNVLKVSLNNTPFYKNAVINRASNIATSSASLDNRSISIADWNKPLLMPATSSADITSTATGFPTPDWIYVARDGSNPGSTNTPALFGSTTPSANNSSSNNSGYVVGRYAYVVYNEGGLLDANVAGSPEVSNMSLTQNQIWTRKGPSVFADLTQLPGLSTLGSNRAQQIVDTLIGWRSQASAQPSGTFPSYTFGGTAISNFLSFQMAQTTSWMTTGNAAPYNNQSDRVFTSRQQLINFLKSTAQNSTELTDVQKSLQYLSTYSRALNQPSYWPPSNRPLVQYGVASTGNTYTGGNSALGLDNVFNPIFKSVQVATPFTRNDGSIATQGSPLVEKRFALSRLCWLTYKGPSATLYQTSPSDPLITQYINDGVPVALLQEGTSTNILNYFGLTWNPGSAPGGIGGFWTYNHGITSGGVTVVGSLNDPGSTSTPKDVLSALREPDFFELLKASVCAGAIAKSKTGANFGTVYSAVPESTVTFQILQLGANIINQANPTQYPIWIKSQDTGFFRNFYGSTDLPYFCSDIVISYISSPAVVTQNPTGTWPPANVISSPPSMAGPPALTLVSPGTVVMMMVPSIWNPYDASGPTLPSPSPLAPNQLRITVVPAGLTDPSNYPGGSPSGAPPALTPTTDSNWRFTPQCYVSPAALSSQVTQQAKWNTEDSTALTFTNVTSLYRQPTVLFQENIPTGSNLAVGSSNVILSTAGAVPPSQWPTAAGFTEASTGTNFIGFLMGTFNQAWTANNSATPPVPTLYMANNLSVSRPGANGSTIRLEFNAGNTTNPYWIPYQEVYIQFANLGPIVPVVETAGTTTNPTLITPVNNGLWSGNAGSTYGGTTGGSWGCYAFDPRSTRWGICTLNPGPSFQYPTAGSTSVNYPLVNSGRPTAAVTTNQHFFSSGASDPNEGWTDITTNYSVNGAAPAQNLNNSAQTHYADPDGTIRPGMAGLVSIPPSSTIGLPTMTPVTPSGSSNPIILHRPFRSVAELGYVFSDTPWRNIDFFTPSSGYAPLLDVFCINEDYRPDALVAGKVDLNTRQGPVIQALLAGAYRDESAVAGSSGSPDSPLSVSNGEVSAIANLLLKRTSYLNTTSGMGPLTNIADLVGHYVSGSNANQTGTLSNTTSTQATYSGFSGDLSNAYASGSPVYNGSNVPISNIVQRFVEAAPRALSDAGQVGTWNLLIDVVAQTGRCSTSASSLSQFMIQGERHYWVHVAIDRQTGKIIDETFEPVSL